MRKELVFKIKNNDYTKDKYYFQKYKKPININAVNIDEIVNMVLINTTLHI